MKWPPRSLAAQSLLFGVVCASGMGTIAYFAASASAGIVIAVFMFPIMAILYRAEIRRLVGNATEGSFTLPARVKAVFTSPLIWILILVQIGALMTMATLDRSGLEIAATIAFAVAALMILRLLHR